MRGRVLALIACLALAACSPSKLNPTNWFSGPERPKPAPLPTIGDGRTARLLWSATVGPAGRFVFTPAVTGEAVYAAATDGTVARLDRTSGQARWRAKLQTVLSGGVGADARTVAVASEEGEVYALDAGTGATRWRARVSSEVIAAPAVAEGMVLVRSADSRIFAFGADDGKRRWVYQRAAAALVVRSAAGVAVSDDLAFAGFSGGKLVAVALANGALRWEATVALPRGTTELERVTDIVGNPAVVGREVCAVAFQGRLACFDARRGTQLWSRELSSISGVGADARYAYAADEQDAVHALDRSSGRSLWKQDRLARRALTVPLAAGAYVAVADLQGYVHFMSRDTGAFVSRGATDGSAVRGAPIGIAEGVLVQTVNGGLFALAP